MVIQLYWPRLCPWDGGVKRIMGRASCEFVMLENKRKETEKTQVKRVAKISPFIAFVQFFFLLQFVSCECPPRVRVLIQGLVQQNIAMSPLSSFAIGPLAKFLVVKSRPFLVQNTQNQRYGCNCDLVHVLNMRPCYLLYTFGLFVHVTCMFCASALRLHTMSFLYVSG